MAVSLENWMAGDYIILNFSYSLCIFHIFLLSYYNVMQYYYKTRRIYENY